MQYKTAAKIQALYADRTDIDYRNSGEAINQTMKILKSGGINSAWIYTGTLPQATNISGLLALRPNINKRVYAVIYVNFMDEYVIDYVHIKDNDSKIINSHPCYIEELAGTYEHMYDSHIRAYQDNFIRL